MSDNEQYSEDEYHFADNPEFGDSEQGDFIQENPSENTKTESSETVGPETNKRFDKTAMMEWINKNTAIRNSLIAIGLIIAVLLLYKIMSGIFSGNDQSLPINQKSTQQTQPAMNSTLVQNPIVNTMPPSVDEKQIKDELANVMQTQENMQSQVSSINTQLTGMSSNVNTVAEKMTLLAQQLEQLATAVHNQAQAIEVLTERTKPKVIPIRPVIHRYAQPVMQYFVQAVIPGRAWLIATNGTTLTVREGSEIPGYGVVKYIDAIQGRVLTSSGRVIRFSQDDS